MVKYKAIIMEYERGWGSRVDDVVEFDTAKERDDYINKFNEGNTADQVPDWYMVAIAGK